MTLSRNPVRVSLVTPTDERPAAPATDAPASETLELDWSIMMAHAQSGDGEAYRRLLAAIAPYVRAMAVRHHRDAADIEDTVQDVLLTVHAMRNTYDQARPFGPWLVSIAHRRIADQLRRQGRRRAREVPFEPRHETFCASEANFSDKLVVTDETR